MIKKSISLNCTKVKEAIVLSNSLSEFMFQIGYRGFVVPRFLRKMFAKGSLHKAWISGFYGGGLLPVMERVPLDHTRSI